jgi:hypothetical protein
LPLINICSPDLKRESLPLTRSRLRWPYAAFFCPAFNFAHLARWNAAILRADGDMVRFTGTEPDVFVALNTTGCDSFLALAHLALCAHAIFRREAGEIIRLGVDVILVGWFACRDVPAPFNDSTAEIAVSSFSTCTAPACALLEAAAAHCLGFPLFPPRYLTVGNIV